MPITEKPINRICTMFKEFVDHTRSIYNSTEFIPLHAPLFVGNEKKYLEECIDSTFVSSVGQFVNDFEIELAKFTGAKYAIVTSNGTSALHIGLILAGVKANELVLTQSLSFIATSNAIHYTGALPLFIDVDMDTMGMSPKALKTYLEKNTVIKDGQCFHKASGKRISACVPMHTFGFACRIDEIKEICDQYNVPLVEDAAESIGTYYKGKHTGLFGDCGTLSFNGNKIITSGGGGALITNNEALAKHAKHLTTQAKVPHPWEFIHDEVGYNYRMPNLNAALALAQLEVLPQFLKDKKKIFESYKNFFKGFPEIQLVDGIADSTPNYWLNTILLPNRKERDDFLSFTNANKVMTRPAWTLLHKLPMYAECIRDEQTNAIELEDRLVNIPSSALGK